MMKIKAKVNAMKKQKKKSKKKSKRRFIEKTKKLKPGLRKNKV